MGPIGNAFVAKTVCQVCSNFQHFNAVFGRFRQSDKKFALGNQGEVESNLVTILFSIFASLLQITKTYNSHEN